jgi:hypothetical protein
VYLYNEVATDCAWNGAPVKSCNFDSSALMAGWLLDVIGPNSLIGSFVKVGRIADACAAKGFQAPAAAPMMSSGNGTYNSTYNGTNSTSFNSTSVNSTSLNGTNGTNATGRKLLFMAPGASYSSNATSAASTCKADGNCTW